MIRKAIAIGAALAAALTVTVSAGAVPCCFENGSFETNNLTGWTANLSGDGDAFTVPGGVSGSYHARVVTDGAGNWQSLSQTSYGPQGWIRGWARFNTNDIFDCPGFNDEAEVLVNGAVIWSVSSCGTGATGWVKFGTWVNSGGRTLTVRVRNGGDDTVDSSVDLDAVFRDVRVAPTVCSLVCSSP